MFDDLPPDGVPAVATALAFAEVAATAVGSLVGGGTYSLATGLGVPRATAIGLAFAFLTCFAAGMAAFSVRSERPAERESSEIQRLAVTGNRAEPPAGGRTQPCAE